MAVLPFTIEVPQGKPITIYAEPDNINFFLNGELEPDTVDGVTNGTSSVGASTRHTYPGQATPVNVSGGSREYLVDPSRKSGNALPGRSFVLVATDEDGAVLEKRQFTFKGRLLDLHAFLSAEVSNLTYLYMNTGARYTLQPTVAP